MGDSSNRDLLNTWLLSKCVPFVREITFENAEVLALALELTCEYKTDVVEWTDARVARDAGLVMNESEC